MKIPRVLSGVLLMSGTSFALRAVGMAFRVYLSGRLGTDGLGLYQLISSLCTFAALLCSTGISTAVMRYCAEKPFQAKAITRRAQMICVPFALLIAAALYFLAPVLCTSIIQDTRAVWPIRIYSLALPFIASSACLRGYFLSGGNVGRVTLAQVIEQTVRITLCICLFQYNFSETSLDVLCSYVFIGTAIGEVISLLTYETLYRFSRPEQHKMAFSPYKPLLAIGIPIILTTLVQSGMQTAENLLIPPMLSLSGSVHTLSEYGLLNGMVLPVLFFPAALPAAIGTLRLPAVARLSAEKNEDALRENVKTTLVSTMMISMLFLALFASLSTPIMQALYKSSEAAGLLLMLSPLLPLLYLDRIADSLLKGVGRQRATLYVEIADSLLRLGLILWLVPKVGLPGLLAMFAISSLLTCVIRIYILLRACKLRSHAFLAAVRASMPSIISGLLACITGLMVAVLPLPPVFATILGGITVGLTFVTFYTFLMLRHRKKHEKTLYAFR